MRAEREALRLGLQIVTAKLAEAMGVPGLNSMAPMTPPTPPMAAPPIASPQSMPPQFKLDPRMLGSVGGNTPGMSSIDSVDGATEQDAELPTTNEQVRDRSAKVAPGRVITTQ